MAKGEGGLTGSISWQMQHTNLQAKKWWHKLLPITLWLPHYKPSLLRFDLFGGIALASYVLPASMAYAVLAGLHPQAGIYCYLVGGVIFAFFTTSKQVALGPTSAISLLVGTTLGALAQGDVAKWAAMSAFAALGVGLISMAAYTVRLNTLVNFISETVLLGFKTGAAITIGITVVPDLLGINGGGNDFFQRIGYIFNHIGEANPTVYIFGIIAFTLLIFGEKYFKGKPTSLIIMALSMVLMGYTGLGSLGFKMVGPLSPGLPNFALPTLDMKQMATMADLIFACFLLAYIESVSAARTLASKHRYEVDTRQELLSIGAGNIGVSLFGGFPIGGGLSQSLVNDQAGARTPISLIVCSLVLASVLLFFSGIIGYLPQVILSAILLQAVLGLFMYKDLKRLFFLDKREFLVAMVALIGVVFFGILKGVVVAALLSLALLLHQTANPYLAILGRIGYSGRFSDIQRHPDNTLIDHILILRVESSFLYFNAQYIHDSILTAIGKAPTRVKILILDMSSAAIVDVAGSQMLAELNKELLKSDIQLKIAEPLATVRDILRKQGIEETTGHLSRKLSLEDIVNESTAELGQGA